ncbi:MAG: ABC transporter permease, partial [Melioribacteraceae bacterium]|nr:ABC transporter permease [Melioribacteraceae bacterium]
MTKIFELLKIAFSALHTNKLRSFLTILGIVVGIFSIISISTVISMLQTSIEEGVSALAKNTFQIQKWPSLQMSNAERAKLVRNRPDIDLEEYYRLQEAIGNQAIGVGGEQWTGGKIIKFESEETNPNVAVCGATPEALPNNNWVIGEGRAFNANDIDSYNRVIVLGADIVKVLFPFGNALGQEVKVDGHRLRVIGILESQGAVFGQSQDNFAIMPITTFMGFYGKRSRSINITLMSHTKEGYDDLIELAEGYFRTIRKVAPGEPNNFDIRTNEAILNQISDMTAGVRIGAFVVGAIALLAAGIGIMNIMLVSVTERTKEIGIRKAIGANKFNIMFQFLVEAVTLSLFGGAIGIFLGVLVGNIAGAALQAVAVVPIDWVIIGFTLCVLIGITFGTYPAYKAS